jgi:D-alanine-D-alanine ligase
VGVHIAHGDDELAAGVADAAKYAGEVLLERFIPGREIQVAVLFDRALGAIEIKPSREFYDYTAKYTAGSTQYLYPAPLPAQQYREAMELGLASHKALGCEGATRTDLRLTPEGAWAVLEVNTLPGMTETSLLPKIAAGEGIDYGELCERLLCSASLKA